MDAFGDHALCCRVLRRTAHHNEVRDEFASLWIALELNVKLDQGPPDSLERLADVLVTGLGPFTPVDVTVLHTLQPSTNLPDVQPA